MRRSTLSTWTGALAVLGSAVAMAQEGPPAGAVEQRQALRLEEVWSIDHTRYGVFAGIDVDHASMEVYVAFDWSGNLRENTAQISFARLDRQGKELGRFRSGPYREGSYGDFRLANLDGEEGPEMLISGVWSKAVHAMDANGNVLWSYVQPHGVDDMWSHDLDGDGRDEVLVGYNAKGGVQVVNPDGTLRWKSSVIGNVWSVAAAPIGPEGELWVIGPGRGIDAVQPFSAEGEALKGISLRSGGAQPGSKQRRGQGKKLDAYWVRPARRDGDAVVVVSESDASALACIGRGGELLWRRDFVVEGQASSRDAMASPDRPWFALAMGDGRIFVHDVQSGERLLSFKTPGVQKFAWMAASGDDPPLLIAEMHNKVTAYAVRGNGPSVREPLPAAAFEGLPAPDPARGEPVAWFGGSYIYAGDLEGRDLQRAIIGPLVEEFMREQKLEPTEAQLRSFNRWFESASPGRQGGAEARAARDEIARAMVRQWLLNKALYERYGGTVIVQQANPMEAVGAMRRFLEEHEAKGTFRVLDPERREAFWSYYTREHPMRVPDKDVDFGRPWWEQRPRR